MNCAGCIFYKALTESGGQGVCRESPPKIFMVPVRSLQGEGFGFQAIYPQVDGSNWCGCWQDLIDHDAIDGDTPLETDAKETN